MYSLVTLQTDFLFWLIVGLPIGLTIGLAIFGAVLGGILAGVVLRRMAGKPPNNAEWIIGGVIVVVIGGIFGIACLLSAVYVISQL